MKVFNSLQIPTESKGANTCILSDKIVEVINYNYQTDGE